MDSNKIIKHLYISSKRVKYFADFFNHVAGVLAVYEGKSVNDNNVFIHIAFDDLDVTYIKLLSIFASVAKSASDDAIIIYTYEENRKDIDELINSDIGKTLGIKIEAKEMQEYISHELIEKKDLDILLYLAYKDEASVRLNTQEGVINELNDTKKAMLNLLEDAYEAQDKMLVQSDNLTKALSESQNFAKKAEEERQNYLLLISSLGESVIALNKENKIDILNNSLLSLLKTDYDSVKGHELNEILKIIDSDNNDLSKEIIEDIINSKTARRIKPFIIERKDGARVYVSAFVSPILNQETKEIQGLIITLIDVGEQTVLEEARVNFISTASHQLRTPLTSIKWFSEMISSGEAGEITNAQKQYLEQINMGIDRMTNLVNYLLRTARVESRRARIIPVNIKIRTIVENCMKKLEPDLKKKNQTINIIGEEIPPIPLDPEYANEVFTNILRNAILYGKENDNIIVEKKKVDDKAVVSITDHGIGIKSEEKERIFKKFFRSENAIISSPDGTGLGLSFVHTLVNEWGGTISFDSEPGVKTTFYVTIPLAGMRAREGEISLTE